MWGLWPWHRTAVHISHPVCVAAIGFNARMFSIYTEWLMTQVLHLKPRMYRHIMLWTRYRSVCVCHPVSGKLALITHSRQARPFFLAPCHIWHPYLLITILASNFSLYFVYNISPFFLCCENEAITSCCRWPQHILTSYRKCKKVHQNIT